MHLMAGCFPVVSSLGVASQLLNIDWTLSQFDSRRDQAVRAYRRFVRQGHGIDIWQGLPAGSLLGSENFIVRMRPRLLDTPVDQNVLRRERDAKCLTWLL